MMRRILAGLLLAALALSANADRAAAFLFRASGGTNIQIVPPAVSVTRTNLSASASPSEGFVSYGQGFAPGEIAAGSSPKVLVGGSAVTTQADQILYHADGSMRWARLSYRVGSAAGHASLVDTVSSQNTAPPTTCARSTTDVSAQDIDITLTGVTNYGGGTEGSGTWRARVNDAISAGGIAVQQIGSGPINCEWKFITPFKDTTGGAVHPQLYEVCYVRAWTNSDTTAGPLEYRCGVVDGWLNSSVSAIGTSSSSATIASSGTFTFTTNTTGLPLYVGMTVAARASAGNYVIGTVTSYSGTTLVLNVIAKHGSGTFSSWDLVASPTSYTFTAALRTGGGAATVRTISNVIITHNAGAWLSGADGQRDWTDSRTPFFMAIDPTYALKSKLYPPYDPTVTSAVADSSYTPATYSPHISGYVGSTSDARNGLGYTADANYYNGAKYVTPGTNVAGDREDLGLAPAWASRAFVNQGVNHWQTVRTRALVEFHMPINRTNPATNRVAVLNNGPDDAGGTFPSLGADFSTTWQNNDSTQLGSDFIGGTGGTNGWAGASGPGSMVDMEHFPSLVALEYLQTGDPEYLDLQQKAANDAVMVRSPTGGRNLNYTVSAVNYKTYGFAGGVGVDIRTDAWAERELALASALTPTNTPESAYFVKLYADNATAIYNLFTVYFPAQSNYAAAFPALGLYWFPELPGVSGSQKTGQLHSFQMHYVMESLAHQYLLTGNSTALSLANYVHGFYSGMLASGWASNRLFEAYAIGGFFTDETTRQTIGSFDRVGLFEMNGTADNNNWVVAKSTAGSATLSLTTNSGGTSSAPLYKMVAGTIVRPTAQIPNSSSSNNGSAPSPELSFGTRYYVKNPSFGAAYTTDANGLQIVMGGTNSIELAASPGGTSIVMSTTVSGWNFVIENPNITPIGELAAGSGYNGPGSYGNLCVAALELASYIGLSGASTDLALMQAVVLSYHAAPNSPSNNNKISFLSAPP